MDIKEMLLKLKNNELREKFLEDLNPDEGWYVWLDQPGLNRKFYRNDLNGTTFVVEMMEILRTYPRKERVWYPAKYYFMQTKTLEDRSRSNPFSTFVASKTMCIDELKKMAQKWQKASMGR